MADPRTDQIAREAARLIELGRANDVDAAIRQAAASLGVRGAPLPGAGRVRRHAQAMSMQALGEQGYNQQRIRVWHIAEQIMSVFEHAMPDAQTVLVGRAAQGHIDAGVKIHIRLHTRASISEMAQAVVDYGYEEPSFQTAQTRHGRLSQMCLTEEGLELVVTRCVELALAQDTSDFLTGKPIETIGLAALRRRLDECDSQ